VKVRYKNVHEYIQYALLKETGIIGKKQAMKQAYTSTGGNKGQGFYSGTGGAPAVAAILLAIHEKATNKNFTVRVEQNPVVQQDIADKKRKAKLQDEIVIAGVGQKVEDILVPMQIFGSTGICDVEVKYGGDTAKTVKIACKKTGNVIPQNEFDIIVFVLGGGLKDSVKFCVGLGNQNSTGTQVSTTGKLFAKKVFSKNLTRSVFKGNKTLNKVATLSTPKGTGQKNQSFNYADLLSCTNSIEISSLSTSAVSGATSINGALMNAIAYSTYCKQEPVNRNNAEQLANHLTPKPTVQEIIDIQCKFDENGSSCFASLLHSNGRYLPIIPTFYKSGGKHMHFLAALKKSWPQFKKNANTCAHYDFAGDFGSTTLLGKSGKAKKVKGKGAVNKGFAAAFPKFNLSLFLANISKATAKQVQTALDKLIENLSATGMITEKGIGDFLKTKGIEVNDLIALIQAGIGAASIKKAAVLAIHNKLSKAGYTGLESGATSTQTKEELIKKIAKIKLSGSSKIKKSSGMSYVDVYALGVTAALKYINNHRKSRKSGPWPQIASISDLKRVAKKTTGFELQDVQDALRLKSAGRLNLAETVRINKRDLRKLILEFLDSNIVNIDAFDAYNVDIDDVEMTPGYFESSINLRGLRDLITVLEIAGVDGAEFAQALNDVLNGDHSMNLSGFDDISFTTFTEISVDNQTESDMSIPVPETDLMLPELNPAEPKYNFDLSAPSVDIPGISFDDDNLLLKAPMAENVTLTLKDIKKLIRKIL